MLIRGADPGTGSSSLKFQLDGGAKERDRPDVLAGLVNATRQLAYKRWCSNRGNNPVIDGSRATLQL